MREILKPNSICCIGAGKRFILEFPIAKSGDLILINGLQGSRVTLITERGGPRQNLTGPFGLSFIFTKGRWLPIAEEENFITLEEEFFKRNH